MNATDIHLLYEYNYWANKRISNAAAKASAEQFTAPTGYSRGSLRGTLWHTMDGEYLWRSLLASAGTFPPDESEEGFPTFEALQARWVEEERLMWEYLNGLKDEDLPGILRYTLDNGQIRERVRWHCLVHLVNHGTQHRSESAAILTGYGHSPGDIDFTLFLNERAGKASW